MPATDRPDQPDHADPPDRPLALVTGASTGIGRSLAQQFADHGFDLVAVADDAELDIAAAGLRQSGAEVTAVRVDLTTEPGVEEVWRVVSDLGRRVDAAALNAGTAANGRFWENSLVDELRVVDLNVRSVVHLAHLLLPDMVARDRGRLLITASVAAKAPGPYYATYAASKAFVHSFAEAVRFELMGTRVTVTSLLPGPTDTAFFGRVGMVQTLVGKMPKDDPDDVARDGYEALMAGKPSVVGGSLVNKAFTVGTRVLPDQVKAFAHSVLTKPRDR